MVRTSAAGIKISAGKSSKKGSSSGGSSSKSSGSSSSTSKGGSRLPPIPHQETPSWQKPITNFFRSDSSSLKITDCTRNENVEEALEEDESKQETHKVDRDGEQTNLANSQEQRHTETNQNQNEEKNSEGNVQDTNKSDSDNKENETDPAKSVDVERHTNGGHKNKELNNCNISESLDVNTESNPPPVKKTKIDD